MSAQKQISLVTGANRGIGLAVCKLLAKKGHHVVLACRKQTAGLKACDEILKEDSRVSGDSLSVVEIDVTKSNTIIDAAALLKDKFGKLDTLTNNAAFAVEENVMNVDLATSRSVFDVNFFGVIEVTNHFLPLLKMSDKGRIVNVSSIMGSLGEHSDPNSAFIREAKTFSYNASKAAINMYTVDLSNKLQAEAKAMGKKAVRVNSVHPGWIQTDLGNLLGAAPSNTEFGAKQIVDILGNGAKGPTGGYFHNRFQLRW